MGRDRTSSITTKNGFIVSTDKDHKGRFRGHQAIIKQNGKHIYRGWHYHVEHPNFSQEQLFTIFENHLFSLGGLIQPIDQNKICVGNVQGFPDKIAFYLQPTDKVDFEGKIIFKSLVLWIGKMGKLHIEPNKCKAYQQAIMKKDDIITFLENLKVN